MVDIVMATYNGARYIREQLDSILNQTYKDIRIIVRDDGSKDNTVDIVHEYEALYPGKVVLITDDVKCGSSRSNFMQAMKFATADYVMCSDQDDYWLPDKIQHSLHRMIAIENRIGKDKPVLVFGSYKPVDENLKNIPDYAKGRQEAAYKLGFSNLLVQNYVNGCLMMINRSLADLLGDYDDRILMHDWWAKQKFDKWMMTNFAYCGGEFHYRDIPPKIIAEQYLDMSGGVKDYKFYCFSGTPVILSVDLFSGLPEHIKSVYDMNWKKINLQIGWPDGGVLLEEKPVNFERMKSFASKLSKEFAFVRVDFFEVNGHLYMGEMTFTSMNGTGIFDPPEWDRKLGDLLILPESMTLQKCQ